MDDMIEQKISDSEPWTNKILCRYRDAPPVKQFLRDGEDRVLVAEITRLRQLLSEAEKRDRVDRAKMLGECVKIIDKASADICALEKVNRSYVSKMLHIASVEVRALQSEER